MEFIDEYTSEKIDINKLRAIRLKIELYCNLNNPDQVDLLAVLSQYVESQEQDLKCLINQSEIVLGNAWKALKTEGGMKPSIYDKTIKTNIYKDYKKKSNKDDLTY